MSKYKELAELACDQSERTFSSKQHCEDAASAIVFGYQKYLQVPEEHFAIVKVGFDLEVENNHQNGFRVNLTLRNDGLWWFGFRIHYELAGRRTFLDEVIKIGIAQEGTKFRVRMDEDQVIDVRSEAELIKLFESIYESDRRAFTSDISSPKAKIGFIQ